MTDSKKTKAELIEELQATRKRVAELEQQSKSSQQDSDSLQIYRPVDRLLELERIAELATWVWDIQHNSAKVSVEHDRIFGTSPDYFKNNSLEQFIKLVHPDDRDNWQEAFNNCIKQISPGKVEYRIIRHDGSERILVDRFDVVCDMAGKPTHLIGSTQDISEFKKVMDALHSEMYFAESLINTAQSIILVLNTNGQIIRFNPYMEMITGYHLEDVKGQNWFDTFIPEKNREHLRGMFDEAIDDIQTRGNINPIVTKDGRERIIEWHDTTLKDSDDNITGLLAIGHDITWRCEIEEVVEQERKLLKTVFAAAPCLQVLKDKNGAYQTVNPAFCQFMGKDENEIIGRTDFDLFTEDIAHRYYEEDRKVIESGQSQVKDELITMPDGESFWFQITRTAVQNMQNNITGILVSMLDITERKLTEQQLVETTKQAREASKAKSQFLARMSHEFRTPLNSILGFAQLLEAELDTATSDPTKKHIQQILDSGWYLLTLVNDVLDLASIEANKLELFVSSINTASLIHECVDIMKPLAQDQNITLVYADNVNCNGCNVKADPLRLKQVLLNLISNAIKYNRDGGSVTINCQQTDASHGRITVTDTGHGIATEDQTTIFEPFSRLYLNTYAAQGTGIGLAITKQLIELMGGSIGIESQPGIGSAFWVELDLADETESECEAETPDDQDARRETNKGQQHTLLYVEDSPSHIQLLEAIVRKMPDIRLLTAHTPKLGLELAQTHKPDMIILDICLPGMDGYEVLGKLQEHETLRYTPVIAISANAMPSEVEKGLQAGFRRYLTKPINISEFKKVVYEVLVDSAAKPGSSGQTT